MLSELRRARYGYWLALHILLLCAAGYSPTRIAAVLFCSRSSVYRAVRAYQHLEINGPWPYKLSAIYYTAEVNVAVKEPEKRQLFRAA